MTALFSWNDSFETHLASVDAQHRRLVDLINGLADLVMSAEEIDPRACASLRDAVIDYAKVHFADEESQMAEAGLDPRHRQAHRTAHRAFLGEVQAMGGNDDALPVERAKALVDYLVRWLAYHILGVDQRMARQMQAIRQGRSAAEAFDDDARDQAAQSAPLLTALSGLFQVVSERNRDLRRLNEELERRVQQRTLELEQANRQLQLLATQDDLTGLPNRRFAMLSLQHLLAEAERYGGEVALLMIDADRFKEVNDRFGHARGDEVLRSLAQQLRDAVRRSDIVCRHGGDEFLVICPRSSRAGAADVARKILATRQPYRDAGGVECWNGSVSIGVAKTGDAIRRPEDLLEAADRAMYEAKRLGGNRIGGEIEGDVPVNRDGAKS